MIINGFKATNIALIMLGDGSRILRREGFADFDTDMRCKNGVGKANIEVL
jgi:hypothetical protein